MIQIKVFCFNPFQENTYVLYNNLGEAIIIDPGCSEESEREELRQFLVTRGLKPKYFLLTHAHVDHVLGADFVFKEYKLAPWMHHEDLRVYKAVANYASNYGFQYVEGPAPEKFLEEGDTFQFGDDELEIIFTPGHSPGSICFYCKKQQFIIVGDVLFYRSIGRTDLPGGDYPTLMRSIHGKLSILPEEVTVYPGHGPSTTIGAEIKYNPFINQGA
jgi:hydroxyacylglutathione hydrolase